MSLVLTLMSPKGSRINDTTLESLHDALRTVGAETQATDWLAPEGRNACDIQLDGISAADAMQIASQALHFHKIDYAVQQPEHRKKGILLCDMESTVVFNEFLDELAKRLGVEAEVTFITHQAMNDQIDFTQSLERRVAILKAAADSRGISLTPQYLEQIYEETVKIVPGAAELVATMRANGAHTMLVSGGLDAFAAKAKDEFGFHEFAANRLLESNGYYEAIVIAPVMDKQGKADILKRTANALGIPLSETMVVGDGANDLAAHAEAGTSVAPGNAKPAVKEAVRAKGEGGLVLRHCDLSAALYAQGYREHEIVRAPTARAAELPRAAVRAR